MYQYRRLLQRGITLRDIKCDKILFCDILKICKDRTSSIYHANHRSFSSSSVLNKGAVILETIFSQENKLRVRSSILSVKPVRKLGTGKKSPTLASVLVPMCTVNGEPSVLFTLRSSQLNSHRGHVSFPGGKCDETDRDAIHTALRETEEEIGLPERCVDVWGPLLPSPSRNALEVTPVIGVCGEIDLESLSINHQEVESVFTRTISSLCDPKNVRSTRFRTGRGYTLPVYLGGEHKIWGLSAVFLHQTLTIIAPGLYNLKISQPR